MENGDKISQRVHMQSYSFVFGEMCKPGHSKNLIDAIDELLQDLEPLRDSSKLATAEKILGSVFRYFDRTFKRTYANQHKFSMDTPFIVGLLRHRLGQGEYNDYQECYDAYRAP